MIIPKIEEINGWFRVHIITEGKCSRDITEKPEWDIWADMSKDEMRELRNALDYKLNFNYKPDPKKENWD